MTVTGRMDANNSEDFEHACQPYASSGVQYIIVDVAGLEYISSMGLRYIVNVGKKLKDNGGALRLVGVQGFVKQLFTITHLNNHFPMFPDLESATADL